MVPAMEPLQLWRWYLPDLKGRLKPSTWRMTEADAQARYPGCQRVEGSLDVRNDGLGRHQAPSQSDAADMLNVSERGVPCSGQLCIALEKHTGERLNAAEDPALRGSAYANLHSPAYNEAGVCRTCAALGRCATS